MADERFDVYTNAGIVKLDYLWPIAQLQTLKDAQHLRRLLLQQMWDVEVRPVTATNTEE